jgi:hypothetical protein
MVRYVVFIYCGRVRVRVWGIVILTGRFASGIHCDVEVLFFPAIDRSVCTGFSANVGIESSVKSLQNICDIYRGGEYA